MVEWLLQHGCDACAPAGERQLTPLHAAALSGDPDTIAVLLKTGGLVQKWQSETGAAGDVLRMALPDGGVVGLGRQSREVCYSRLAGQKLAALVTILGRVHTRQRHVRAKHHNSRYTAAHMLHLSPLIFITAPTQVRTRWPRPATGSCPWSLCHVPPRPRHPHQ